MPEICIYLVFEDALHEAVIERILAASRQTYCVGIRYNGGGFGWIQKRINGFNMAAKGMPYLVLTDLDRHECAPALINAWLTGPRNPNLIFRVAVRQVEAWLLACRSDFARFAGVEEHLIPADTDRIENSKKFLIDLVRHSGNAKLRSDIVPARGSTAKVGPNYNGRLISFVEKYWDPAMAKDCSLSLRRAVEALDVFEPIFERPRN
jgi:hypothetical protein